MKIELKLLINRVEMIYFVVLHRCVKIMVSCGGKFCLMCSFNGLLWLETGVE